MPHSRSAFRMAVMFASVLALASTARAQITDTGPLVSIPLRDAQGTVRAYMSYRRAPDGNTIIYFVDAASRSQIGAIGAERVSAQLADRPAGGVQVGTVRDHRADPGGRVSGQGGGSRGGTDLDEGRSDGGSDVRQLRQQLDLLTRAVRELERRLNAVTQRL